MGVQFENQVMGSLRALPDAIPQALWFIYPNIPPIKMVVVGEAAGVVGGGVGCGGSHDAGEGEGWRGKGFSSSPGLLVQIPPCPLPGWPTPSAAAATPSGQASG